MTSFSEVECVEIADTLRQSSYCVYIPGLYTCNYDCML